MAIIYKINVLEALKAAGYSTYRIRTGRLLSEATLTRLRRNEMISMDSLEKICGMLRMQPGDVIEYREES